MIIELKFRSLFSLSIQKFPPFVVLLQLSLKIFLSVFGCHIIIISGTRDLWTLEATPLQPPRMLYLVAIMGKFLKITLVGPTLKAFISPQIKTILWLSAVVPTDIVRVSEPAMCTFRLSVRIFTPLPDGGEKTQNPGFDILNLGSPKFWKFSKIRSSI